MIDNYLLEQLITFAEFGTLAATAEHLLITQPSVTRGMQKLEAELGVTLFDRKPNKISLTKTGKLAVLEARKVLEAQANFIQIVQNFEHQHQTVQVDFTLPGPRLILQQKPLENVNLSTGLLKPADVSYSLLNRRSTLILSNQEIYSDQIESLYLVDESLFVNVDTMTTMTDKHEITFEELHGMSFLVLSDIGIWQDIIEHEIPNAKFLYQKDNDNFLEIRQHSFFPYFITNLTQKLHFNEVEQSERRTSLRITDAAASIPIYANYLIENKERLSEVLVEFRQGLS